jgi:hypothetical protein
MKDKYIMALNKKDLKRLKEYISSIKENYKNTALIFINGPAGCGKTMFVDNFLKDYIEMELKPKGFFIFDGADVFENPEKIQDFLLNNMRYLNIRYPIIIISQRDLSIKFGALKYYSCGYISLNFEYNYSTIKNKTHLINKTKKINFTELLKLDFKFEESKNFVIAQNKHLFVIKRAVLLFEEMRANGFVLRATHNGLNNRFIFERTK